ncbi:hypothetical protein CFP56_042234 [Quercus suber]|uniref:Uncharacterized protein n=1 Tax=Quercus suber TaxID=58331 RepID=A0AAW0M895_QUESU
MLYLCIKPSNIPENKRDIHHRPPQLPFRLVEGLEEIDVRKKYKRRGIFRNIPNWEKKGAPFMNHSLKPVVSLIQHGTWNMLAGTSIQIIQSAQSGRVFC